jgi:hypothetical protein
MAPNKVIIYVRRCHSNGWFEIVAGTAAAGYVADLVGPVMPRGPELPVLGPFELLERAKSEADRVVAETGHVCDGGCEPWSE